MAHALQKEQAGLDNGATASAERASPDRKNQVRAVAEAWLAWQCRMVAGVIRGAVFSVDGDRLDAMLSQWPVDAAQQSAMGILANEAVNANELIIHSAQRPAGAQEHAQDHLAMPIVNDNDRFIVVLHLAARSQSQQNAVVQLVQWGGMWLGSLDAVVSDIKGSASSVSIELAEQVIAHQDLYAACLETANQLASDLHCQRVSVGLMQGSVVRLQAISQISNFDERVALVRSLEAAMEEAVDQATIINLSASEKTDFVLTRAHEQLQAAHGGLVSCTVPLYCNNEVVGAVLLERSDTTGFNTDAVNHASTVLAPIGPVLQLVAKEQRSTWVRANQSVRSWVKTRQWPQSKQGKAILAALALAVLAILFLPVSNNVTATANIEGSDKQVLVAPQAGYVKSAHARAGDRVSKGQLIAALEDKDLIIEKEKWLGELGKLDTSLARALSSRDRSELGMLQARKAQVDAELALIDQKLQRAQLTAPFDGVLVSGDLNQMLGAPVEVGQVLFEVASMEAYRLVLNIDEHDVAGIEAGQSGVLRFSALPGNKHEFTTESILPVALTRDRKSVFSVDAVLTHNDDSLRPGMRGVAKINVGRMPLIVIWAKGVYAKLRLWLWKAGL